MKKIQIIITTVLGLTLASAYNVGDTVSMNDQNQAFSVCNGDYYYDDFKLADLNGDFNGGHYFVSMIDISATWCPPCVDYASTTMSNVADEWADEPHVKIITSLSDLNQPYSCGQWGNLGSSEEDPFIFHDPSYKMIDWFGCCNNQVGWPSTVFINENMKVHFLANYMGTYEVNYIIEQMLDNCDDCDAPMPMALFYYIIDGLSVTFIDLSLSETSDLIEWQWDFGDGNTSYDQSPIHIYENGGTFTVTLDVVDHYGTNGIQHSEEIVIGCADGESADECGICSGDGPQFYCEITEQYYCTEDEMDEACELSTAHNNGVTKLAISNVYPNPFNPQLNIDYQVQNLGNISIEIHDINGKLVDEIFNGTRSPGHFSMNWDAGQYTSGLYFIHLRSRNQVQVQKALLLK